MNELLPRFNSVSSGHASNFSNFIVFNDYNHIIASPFSWAPPPLAETDLPAVFDKDPAGHCQQTASDEHVAPDPRDEHKAHESLIIW